MKTVLALTIVGLGAIMAMAGPASPVNGRMEQFIYTLPSGQCLASANCFPKPTSSGPGATGVPAGTSLTACGSSITVTTNNTVIDGCIYTGRITVNATGVMIRNSEIYQGVWSTDEDDEFTVEDSIMGPPSGCETTLANGMIGHKRFTMRRSRIRNTTEGIRLAGGEVQALIEDNFLGDFCDTEGAHPDGIQTLNTTCPNTWVSAVFRHNTVDTRGVSGSQPIFFAGCPTHGTIQDNLAMGGTYPLQLRLDPLDVDGPWVVTGNRVVEDTYTVGPKITVNVNCEDGSIVWSDNKLVTIDGSYNLVTVGSTLVC